MGLSCECPDWDGEEGWAYFPPDDFVKLDTKRGRRCCSCSVPIKVGDECLRFDRERAARYPVEENIYGDTVPMAPLYMCGECSEIYLNLSDVGYCIPPDDDMRDCLAEYHNLTGFKPYSVGSKTQ